MDMGLMIWLGAATLGAAAAAGFLAQLRSRLTSRARDPEKFDPWRLSRGALVGLTLSLVTLGAGVGGAFVTARGTPGEDLTGPALDEMADLPVPGENEGVTAMDSSRGEAATSTDSAAPEAADASGAAETPGAPDTARLAGEVGADGSTDSPSGNPAGDGVAGSTTGTQARTAIGESTTSRSAASAGSGEWAVRVGVFGRESNVESALEELDEAGLTGFVVPRLDDAGRELSYVYAGRFETRSAAESAATRVQAAGMEAMVVSFVPPS